MNQNKEFMQWIFLSQTMLLLVPHKFPPYQTTFKRVLLQLDLHSYYIQTIYNGRQKIINNIFSTYVEPLLNDIHHTALLQEWKLNLDAAEY